MKRKFLSVVSAIIILIMTACGANSEPTLSAADVANTAIAIAWTEVSMTQAAMPTATATTIPPTLTPLPPTFMTLPAPVITMTTIAPTAVVNITATADTCNDPPPFEPKGTMVQVKFVNESDGSVNLAFGMNQPNSLGECGTYSFSMGRFDEPVVKVLAGCYWAYAWVTGEKPSTARNIEALCVTDPNLVPAITIGPEVIGFD